MNVIGHFEIEPARVKKEPAETRMEWDLLKKNGSVFCEGVAAHYAVMEKMRL